MKLHNLTVKGNQAPAPLWYDVEVQYMTQLGNLSGCQPQPSGRYFPAFDYSALPNVLTQLLEVTELAKSASLGLSHCLHSDRCEKTVTAMGWAHML